MDFEFCSNFCPSILLRVCLNGYLIYQHESTLKIFILEDFPIQVSHHLASNGRILLATQTIAFYGLTREAKCFHKE